MVEIVLLSPLVFGMIGVLASTMFRKVGWNVRFSRILLLVSVLALVLYIGGYFGSFVADWTHHGSGEQFDWSPWYKVTLPIAFWGALLSIVVFISSIVAVVCKVVHNARTNSEQCAQADRKG